MATIYSEFDSTVQTLISDLLTKILTSSDWSRVSSTAALFQTTALMNVGATTITHASGAAAAAGIGIGSVVRLGAEGAADCEYRTVTAQAATTLTIAASTYTHASGSNVYLGNTVVKATTTDGADMIWDLTAAGMTQAQFLSMAAYQSYTGGVAAGVVNRYLHYRATTATGGFTSTVPVHCIVSAGKNHLFLSVEGPRGWEANPDNTTYGSVRNYCFLSALTKYHAGDTTPVVVAGGATTSNPSGTSLTNQSHMVHVSRNYGNTASWTAAKLLSLGFVTGNSITTAVHSQRTAVADSNYYCFPYVVVDEQDGLRGRLSSFFFAGLTQGDITETISYPPVGATLTIDGVKYKLLGVNKGANQSQPIWQQFGSGNDNSSTSVNATAVVAVPTV